MKSFPTYLAHAVAACFNCTHVLTVVKPEDSGYAPRHGEFRKACPRCGMLTFYDVRKAVK